jgi:hypothetical protein
MEAKELKIQRIRGFELAFEDERLHWTAVTIAQKIS